MNGLTGEYEELQINLNDSQKIIADLTNSNAALKSELTNAEELNKSYQLQNRALSSEHQRLSETHSELNETVIKNLQAQNMS